MSGIVLESVTKEFPGGVVAVQDVSFEVAPDEFLVLVGPSGCGKTTTLRMVAGLEEVSSGEISIGGRHVTNLPPRSRDIAMVFQNYALYAHMTVRANMAFGLKMAKLPKHEQHRRVEQAAEMLGITTLLDRKPKQLSGGQRQRVAMGRAIVREPAAFLMDEPLSNLDAKLRVEMRSEISNLQQRIGTPTLYVTHDQTEAVTMGDRVAILNAGVLVQLGTPEDVYEHPVNVFVAGFIGSPAMNLVRSTLVRERDRYVASFGDSRVLIPPNLLARRPALDAYAGRELILGVRPEDFTFGGHPPAAEDGVVEAMVVRAESLGAEQIVYFKAGSDSSNPPVAARTSAEGNGSAEAPAGLLTARLDRRAPVRDGDRANLSVDLERLYFFDEQTGEAISD
jgi:multiple sugar transport system ATP-binding protein